MVRLNLQVKKVNWYPYLNLHEDYIIYEVLLLAFLHVSFTDEYQTILMFHNSMTAKASFGVPIYNCLSNHCF